MNFGQLSKVPSHVTNTGDMSIPDEVTGRIDLDTLDKIMHTLSESTDQEDIDLAAWIEENYLYEPITGDNRPISDRESFDKLSRAYKRVRQLTNRAQDKWPFFDRHWKKEMSASTVRQLAQGFPEALEQLQKQADNLRSSQEAPTATMDPGAEGAAERVQETANPTEDPEGDVDSSKKLTPPPSDTQTPPLPQKQLLVKLPVNHIAKTLPADNQSDNYPTAAATEPVPTNPDNLPESSSTKKRKRVRNSEGKFIANPEPKQQPGPKKQPEPEQNSEAEEQSEPKKQRVELMSQDGPEEQGTQAHRGSQRGRGGPRRGAGRPRGSRAGGRGGRPRRSEPIVVESDDEGVTLRTFSEATSSHNATKAPEVVPDMEPAHKETSSSGVNPRRSTRHSTRISTGELNATAKREPSEDGWEDVDSSENNTPLSKTRFGGKLYEPAKRGGGMSKKGGKKSNVTTEATEMTPRDKELLMLDDITASVSSASRDSAASKDMVGTTRTDDLQSAADSVATTKQPVKAKRPGRPRKLDQALIDTEDEVDVLDTASANVSSSFSSSIEFIARVQTDSGNVEIPIPTKFLNDMNKLTKSIHQFVAWKNGDGKNVPIGFAHWYSIYSLHRSDNA